METGGDGNADTGKKRDCEALRKDKVGVTLTENTKTSPGFLVEKGLEEQLEKNRKGRKRRVHLLKVK